jgi:2-pyrone-4,6-dicarboxylate lactonase
MGDAMERSERMAAPQAGFRPPPGACDCHCHIVGPQSRFPLAPERRAHGAQDAAKEALLALHTKLGVDRAVIVHSALHGTDLSATLDALAFAPERLRGVALVEFSISDAELERLHAAGFRGVRHNLVNLSEGPSDPEAFLRLGDRLAELGWHVLLHMRAEQIFPLAPLLRRLRAPIVFDHLMRIDPAHGAQQPALRSLEDFVADGAWVKIGAVDKLSRQPYPHLDAAEIAARFVEAAPDRVIWGSDWPHPDGRGLRGGRLPDDQRLLDLAPLYAPDPDARRRLLVDNPARLYDFAPA